MNKITERIDAITRISAQYLGEVIPAPKSVKIEITATCNYACSFCTKSLHPDGGHMDRALYSRLIREMRACGVEELGVFYIGESFTCKWLPDAIKEAKDVGYPYVFLTTNGVGATEARVRECFDAGLDSLKFSLNFADSVQLRDVAKVHPRNFDRALYNLQVGWTIILVVLIGLTLPQFVPARVSSSRNACIANLKQIQGAKETWALENKKGPTDVPWPADLIGSVKYIRATPVCPAGSSYRLGAVGEKATCSVSGPGHTIEYNR